jgi:glycosyltransferase involved in cell wall biosynthesis
MSAAPKILLLSAYRSDSHGYWADWLQEELDADWRVLELPGRYFRWRIRGNPLSWLDELAQLLTAWQPDRILATSMVDLATLKGLFPALAGVPCSYYFHENQFAYPVASGQHSSIDPLMVQLYGALAADELLFNSRFNQQSFLDGVDALLQRLPDHLPENITIRLEKKCRWLPVPVVVPEPTASAQNNIIPLSSTAEASANADVTAVPRSTPLLLWNHRWEYDKQPEDFLQLLTVLKRQGIAFRLALLGPRPSRVPAALTAIRQQFAEAIVVDGRVSREAYIGWLIQADVVVSTAIHEFQGVSVLEAAAMGAIPLVPDALCYREQYPAMCRYPPGDMVAAGRCLVGLLGQPRPELLLRPWLANDPGYRVCQPDTVATVLASEGWQQWLLNQSIDGQ